MGRADPLPLRRIGTLTVCTKAREACPCATHRGGGKPPRNAISPAYFTWFFSQDRAFYRSKVAYLPKNAAKIALYLCCYYIAFWAKCQLFVSKLCPPGGGVFHRGKTGENPRKNLGFSGFFTGFSTPSCGEIVTILSPLLSKIFCRLCTSGGGALSRPEREKARPCKGAGLVWFF